MRKELCLNLKDHHHHSSFSQTFYHSIINISGIFLPYRKCNYTFDHLSSFQDKQLSCLKTLDNVYSKSLIIIFEYILPSNYCF